MTPTSVFPEEQYTIRGRLPKGERHHRHRREVVVQVKRKTRWVVLQMTGTDRRGRFAFDLSGLRRTTTYRVRAERDFMFRRTTILGKITVPRAAQRVEITRAPTETIVIPHPRQGAPGFHVNFEVTVHPRRAGVRVVLNRVVDPRFSRVAARGVDGRTDRRGEVTLSHTFIAPHPGTLTWVATVYGQGMRTTSKPVTLRFRDPVPAEHCREQTDLTMAECLVVSDLRAQTGSPLETPFPCVEYVTCEDGVVTEVDLLSDDAIPAAIFSFSHLRTLRLSGHGITALPDEITNLTELRRLDILRAPLPTLNPRVGELPRLERLQIFDTQLSALPPELGQLTTLKTLSVRDSALTGVPAALSGATALTRVELSGNQIVDPPLALGELPHLEWLSLGQQALRGDVSPLVGPMHQRAIAAGPGAPQRAYFDGTGCVHVGGNAVLEAWLDQWAGPWRGTGCD